MPSALRFGLTVSFRSVGRVFEGLLDPIPANRRSYIDNFEEDAIPGGDDLLAFLTNPNEIWRPDIAPRFVSAPSTDAASGEGGAPNDAVAPASIVAADDPPEHL